MTDLEKGYLQRRGYQILENNGVGQEAAKNSEFEETRIEPTKGGYAKIGRNPDGGVAVNMHLFSSVDGKEAKPIPVDQADAISVNMGVSDVREDSGYFVGKNQDEEEVIVGTVAPPSDEDTVGDSLREFETFLNAPFSGLARGIARFGANVLSATGLIDQESVDEFTKMVDDLTETATEGNIPAAVSGMGGELAGQYALPAVGIYNKLRALGAGPLLSSIISESGVGLVGMSPNEENLFNLIPEDSEMAAPIREFLATDPDDPEWLNRSRNASEALIMLGAGEAAVRSFISGIEKAKRIAESPAAGKVFKAIDDASERVKSKSKGNTMSSGVDPSDALGMLKPVADALRGVEPPPPFFSAVEKSVEALPMEKGSAAQFRAMIAKGAGVKQEEMAWIGLDDFLKGKKNVTKKEILEYVQQNRVEIEDVVKQGGDGGEGGWYIDDEAMDLRVAGIDDEWFEQQGAIEGYEVNVWGDEDLPFPVDSALILEKVDFDDVDEVQRIADHVDLSIQNDQAFFDEELNGALPEYDELIENFRNNPKKYADDMKEMFGDYYNSALSKSTTFEVSLDRDGTYIGTYNTLDDAQIEAGDYLRDIYSDELGGAGGDTKWGQYTLPGGENYREVLLTLPESTGGQGELFRGGHFNEENILAHLRLKDRVGPNDEKILFIEEIQSDWHQQGRERGYRVEDSYTVSSQRGTRLFIGNEADARRFIDERPDEGLELVREGVMNQGVPDAPLKKTWHEMAFRRVARIAAEEGYDSIAWTPGKVQIDRYETSLRQNVDSIIYEKMDDGTYAIGAQKGGKSVYDNEGLSEDELKELLGKELSEKITKDTGIKSDDLPLRPDARVLQGDDLAIGGAGMKGFYDKMLPTYANKFGKKFGAKVGVIELPDSGGKFKSETEVPSGRPLDVVPMTGMGNFTIRIDLVSGRGIWGAFDTREQALKRLKELQDEYQVNKAWHLPVTDKMRDTAMKKGFPLFSAAPVGAGAIAGQQRLSENQDFGDIMMIEDVDVEGTGETVQVQESAQRRFEQTMKRKNMIEQLKGCLSGV